MIQIPKLSTTDGSNVVCLPRTEFARYATDTDETVYQALSHDYTVTLNGIPCEVRSCRVSALPFNRPWPGKQRPYDQSEAAGFLAFAADEAVELRVKRNKEFEKAAVRPRSKGVKVQVKEGEAIFVLSACGSYVLEFGDSHHVLHIFFDPIKEYPEAKEATLFFGPGFHFPGIIPLRDNDRVYIDREAVVFGSVYAVGAKNVKIFGGGVIDNSCEERLTENCYEAHAKGTFRIYDCENVEEITVC